MSEHNIPKQNQPAGGLARAASPQQHEPQPAPASRPPVVDREVRAPIRDAAARARELREGSVFHEDGSDKYYIPPHEIPDGWSYEYKRCSVYGQEEKAHQMNVQRRGWEVVPASRHPNIMCEQDGLILMERPKEITDEAKRRDLRKARMEIAMKEEQLRATPAGTLPRDEGNAPRASIVKTYAPISIPE